MPTTTALPAKLRLARNIQEGYEVLTTDKDGNETWGTVTHTLELLAPIAMVCLTVEVDGESTRLAITPSYRVMSRRSAS